MNRKPKAGFLPLYLLTYDNNNPFMRKEIDRHVALVAQRLRDCGLELTEAPVCRVKSEFDAAVKSFEAADVDLIISLHAAYSPSLESVGALCSTSLPLLMLDTTYNYEFKPYSYTEGMLYNHGIHGVMDLCNLLRRRGRQYEIIAGFFGDENPGFNDLRKRVMNFASACVILHTLRHSRVGLVGDPFEGMGDFRIPFEEMESKLGIRTVHYDTKNFTYLDAVTQAEIDAEYRLDSERFEMNVSRATYDLSARVSLAIRHWMEAERLNAFTMNFKAAALGTAFPVIPFAEASIAMGRGVGYAGEGDVLTAAFTASLMSVFREVSFTEIFCPDWKGNTLFFSHMGEYNVALSCPDHKPVMREKDFVFGDSANPAVVLAPFQPGRVAFVSFNPAPGGRFELFRADGEMLYTPADNRQNDVVSGWFRPQLPLGEFLENYSRAGGMHHAALIYTDADTANILDNLARIL